MIISSIIKKSQFECAHRMDAEYYQPEYLELEEELYATDSYKLWKNIDGRFITGPFGSEFNVENYTSDSKYRYIRGKDVKKFFLLGDDNVYIPEKDFERLKKYSLRKGDILVSVVGTLGNTAIVDHSALPAIFSCKSTAFRTEAINPYYFIAYLNSCYGQSLLERSARGAVQTGLNIDDLKSLPVFIPSREKQETIASTILKASRIYYDSKYFYSQAEQLLLEELGIEDLDWGDELFYTAPAKEMKKNQRFDAEYWQPKYEKLLIFLKNKFEIKRLRDLVSIKKGIEPGSERYQEEGKPFIRVSNLSKFGINDNNQKYLTGDFYQELKKNYQPRMREILLSKDATPGIAYVVKEPIEGIIAGGILRLRIKVDLEPEYLALIINSQIGQYQMERDTGGSVIVHWRPEQIRNACMPIIEKSAQQKITSLVKRSHSARKKGKELLEEAKEKVEKMIL